MNVVRRVTKCALKRLIAFCVAAARVFLSVPSKAQAAANLLTDANISIVLSPIDYRPPDTDTDTFIHI